LDQRIHDALPLKVVTRKEPIPKDMTSRCIAFSITKDPLRFWRPSTWAWVGRKMRESKNLEAEEVCGKRGKVMAVELGCKEDACILNDPFELGYTCPICGAGYSAKEIHKKEWNEVKLCTLEWSEYASFLWCAHCNLDIPSILCRKVTKKNIPELTTLYLQIIDSLKKYWLSTKEEAK